MSEIKISDLPSGLKEISENPFSRWFIWSGEQEKPDVELGDKSSLVAGLGFLDSSSSFAKPV